MAPVVKKVVRLISTRSLGQRTQGRGANAAVATSINEGNKGLNSIGLSLNGIAESMKDQSAMGD